MQHSLGMRLEEPAKKPAKKKTAKKAAKKTAKKAAKKTAKKTPAPRVIYDLADGDDQPRKVYSLRCSLWDIHVLDTYAAERRTTASSILRDLIYKLGKGKISLD